MIEDTISFIFINESHQIETIRWPLKDSDYVEQLIQEVLERKGIGPVYRTLFGLKSTAHDIWLPPNLRLKKLKEETKNNIDDLKLQLRFRFIPSCYKNLNKLDKEAFDIIFAQLRHDFIETKFNEDKRDFVLLNDAVLGLIATDLLRHSLENNIVISEILKRVNPKEFIPKRASKWQSLLLFRHAEQINLQKTLEVGYANGAHDLENLKLKFIHLFLSEVSQDYGIEMYMVERVTLPSKEPCQMQLRVRYHRANSESFCYIEYRSLNKKHGWEELCDIETISHVTLQKNIIQIARLNGCPMVFRFKSNRHCESFVSCVDGYYRLMRKWNFHLCREIFSPELMFLRRVGCHGPIGCVTSHIKLAKERKDGIYLIRKCMEKTNRYLIDVNVSSDAMLTIDVDFNPETKLFKITDHEVSTNIVVEISSGFPEYDSLKNLVQNISIWVDSGHGRHAQPLTCPLLPGDYDDYPALMLCISKNKLRELVETEGTPKWQQHSLPNLIPTQMIKMTGKELARANNGQLVRLAQIGDDQSVVIKSTIHDLEGIMTDPSQNNRLAFYYHYMDENNNDESSFEVDQLWRNSWLFIKHQFIAETIGLDAASLSLIQDYYPQGSLDKFLQKNIRVTSVFKLAIAFQLAQALIYLREKQLIHGKIRCHNLFLKQTNPVHIKLADPLGPFDAVKDQAFIPVNYHGIRGLHRTKQYDYTIDVWAFGTTMWQIYNNGVRPPEGQFANCTLTRPKDCSTHLWDLIESCWLTDPKRRASPESLFRDLNQLSAWEKGVHDYFYIEQEASSNQDDSSSTTTQGSNGSPLRSLSTNMTDLSSLSTTTTTTTTTRLASDNTSSNSNLLKILESGYRKTASSKAAASRAKNLLSSNSSCSSYSSPVAANSSNNKRHKAPWKSIVNFRSRQTGLLGGQSNENRNPGGGQSSSSYEPYPMDSCSRLSLSDCSTPSGSEITKLTDVLDFQSIPDVFDRVLWHVDSNRLKLGPEIGRGTSGIVIKGVLSHLDSLEEQVVAVKCIDTDCLDFNLNKIEDLRREFDILKNLNHKNIVRTLGYVEESYMMLIFEYMPLGSLLCCIRDSHHDDIHALPLAKYAHDIAQGMEYLENMKIVHRDLALRNILAKSLDEVKICDFGLAQFLGSSNHYKLKTERALPLKWYAPETLTHWTFTHKTDVWSYGVVLWEIYSGGNSPQYTGTYANLAETLKSERLPAPKRCPEHMYDLMLKCWAYEPENRDTFAVISEKLSQYSHA